MALDTPDYDAQDSAEAYDEDNLTDDMDRLDNGDELNFDTMTDVLDVTRAAGDEDDDAAVIGDDLDDDDLVEMVSDADGDAEDLEDDEELTARDDGVLSDGSNDDLSDDDDDNLDAIDAEGEDEVALTYQGDLNDTAGARSGAQRLESARLSDADLRDLDYQRGQGGRADASPNDKPNQDDADNAPDALDEHAKDKAERQDALLDEGVEETFPASDPVSVKHIT